MKKISINLFFIFALVLSCLSAAQAQVIEMVYYTPNSQGNYHTLTSKDRAYFRSSLTANQLTALSDKLKLTANNINYSTINLNSGRDMHILISTSTSSQAHFNTISVYNGGEFIQYGSDTKVGSLQAAELSGKDIALSSSVVTIPESGQLVIDNVPMNNPKCSLGFKNLQAKNEGGNTSGYSFAYCTASACTDTSKPHYCHGACQECPCGQFLANGACRSFSGTFNYMPAVASCSAGWNGGSATSGAPDGNNCIFSGAPITGSQFKCTDDVVTICAAGYVYNNEYLNKVTSAEMANPDILYVADTDHPTGNVQCGGQTLDQPAVPYHYVAQYVPSTGEYLPYPIDNMASGSCTGRNNFISNTRTMYCGFKTENSLPFSYAQQAISAMKNNPFCMASPNNGAIPSCYSLLSSAMTLEQYNANLKNLPAEYLCTSIYRVNNNVGDATTGAFSCAVNAPEPDSYQAYRTISYNVTNQPVSACYGSTCNYNGQNYCRNTVTLNVRVAEPRSTSALPLNKWVNVDSQGYSKQSCSGILNDQTTTELLGDSTTTHYLNQKISAKVLTCKPL